MNHRRLALEAICQKYSIAILYSFGSRAKTLLAWLADPTATLAPGSSDVDIGVKPLPGIALHWKDEVGLAQDFEDFLDVPRVDLVNLDKANPYLAAEIIHGERLYAANEYAADNYDLFILRQEADLAPLEEEKARILLGTTLDRMGRQLEQLPLHNKSLFFADSRNVYTAESCLRRSLEALLDIGRHILAKGYGVPASTYKDVATLLAEQGVLNEVEEKLLRQMAGYRNRLVHLYHEVSAEELYQICVDDLEDIQPVRSAFQHWMQANPDKVV